MSRLSLTASQKGLLKASATGISFGIVSLRAPANPPAVDRVLAADELDIRWSARCIDIERPPQGRDDLGWLAHPLGMEAEGADHLRHIHLVVAHDLVREGVVSWPPEAGSIAGEAAIADV